MGVIIIRFFNLSQSHFYWISLFPGTVNDWRGFIGEDITGEEMKRFRQHERTGRPMGDMDFIEGIEKSSCRLGGFPERD